MAQIDIFNTNNKYKIIYADPPWKYKDKCNAGKRGAEFKYECMNIEDIKNLPINEISSKNSVLFLWVTFPMLQNGLDLIKAWGFEYKTIGFNWIKKNKKANSLFWGMGNWTRSNSEICLLATKGKPKRIAANIHSVIVTPIEAHSKKPNKARERIVKLCGNISKIELFAREQVENWDCWGNEINKGSE